MATSRDYGSLAEFIKKSRDILRNIEEKNRKENEKTRRLVNDIKEN